MKDNPIYRVEHRCPNCSRLIFATEMSAEYDVMDIHEYFMVCRICAAKGTPHAA